MAKLKSDGTRSDGNVTAEERAQDLARQDGQLGQPGHPSQPSRSDGTQRGQPGQPSDGRRGEGDLGRPTDAGRRGPVGAGDGPLDSVTGQRGPGGHGDQPGHPGQATEGRLPAVPVGVSPQIPMQTWEAERDGHYVAAAGVRDFHIRVAGVTYEHCGELADGRWVYKAGK